MERYNVRYEYEGEVYGTEREAVAARRKDLLTYPLYIVVNQDKNPSVLGLTETSPVLFFSKEEDAMKYIQGQPQHLRYLFNLRMVRVDVHREDLTDEEIIWESKEKIRKLRALIKIVEEGKLRWEDYKE